MSYETREDDGGIHLLLEIQYPNAWTLQVTEGTAADLLAHTVFNASDGLVKCHFTAYSDALTDVEDLVEAARATPLTESIVVMQRRFGYKPAEVTARDAARDLFVEYPSEATISDALMSEGFIQESPVRVSDGIEHWSVFLKDADRDRLRERLDAVREHNEAEITVARIVGDHLSGPNQHHRVGQLSDRQREIFELAREHNYYSWPRETTTRDIASLAGVSKTTVLKHLRQAEAKLLDPADEPEDVLG